MLIINRYGFSQQQKKKEMIVKDCYARYFRGQNTAPIEQNPNLVIISSSLIRGILHYHHNVHIMYLLIVHYLFFY